MRPLNFIENMYLLMGGPAGCVVVTAVELTPVDHEVDWAALERAAREVQRHYELLQVQIEPRKGRFVEVGGPAVVRLSDSAASVEAHLENELATPLPTAPHPLWRMTIVRPPDGSVILLLTIHHAAADAVGIQNIFTRVLELYTQIASGKEPASPRPARSTLLSVYMQRRARETATARRFEGLARRAVARAVQAQMLATSALGAGLSTLKPQPAPAGALAPRVTKVQCVRVPLHDLVAHARAESTSVNSIITSAFAHAYATVTDPAQKLASIRTYEAVDLRAPLGVPRDELGVYVYSAGLDMPLRGLRTLAEQARVHRELLGQSAQEALAKLPVLQDVFTARFVRALHRVFQKIDGGRVFALQLSNWGPTTITAGPLFRLRAVNFRAGYETVGSRYQVGVVTVDDALNLCLGYQPHAMPADVAEQITRLAAAELRALAESTASARARRPVEGAHAC